ncbi:MAG: sulfatase [Bacteroidota bacterium]
MTRLLASLFLILILLSSCEPAREKQPSERPNILFIMSDDHTSQAWGIYGGILDAYAKNEHIKRLAEEGARLDKVFCTNSICVPSRASILTGQYSHQNGVYTLADALDPTQANIAKTLSKAGYETAIIGKWHLKTKPSGFEHYRVLPGQGRYHDPILKGEEDWDGGGKAYQGFSADVIGDLSLDWLKQRDESKPFMLMTHFKATHEPFDYPARYKDLNEGVEFPEPSSLYDFSPETNGRSFLGQKLWILGERWEKDSEREISKQRYPGMPFSLEGLDSLASRKKIYQKFVGDFLKSGAAIDDNIGKLLDYLAESGLAENTVVIYTADQGYFLGEHGFFDKRMIYEQAIQMPFVIRYPKEIPAGSQLSDLILNLDFPALFADYAGITQPDYIKGRSFRENLKGKTPSNWRKEFYYRYWLHREERPAHFGIRDERYKLAFFYGQALDMTGAIPKSTPPAWEFYDLQEDPKEDHNAINDPQYAEVIAQMKGRLIRIRENVEDTDTQYPELERIIERSWEE